MLFLWLYIYKHVLYIKSCLSLLYFIYVENKYELIEKLITKNFRGLFYKSINSPFSYMSTDSFWSEINQFLLCLYVLFWNYKFSVHLLAIFLFASFSVDPILKLLLLLKSWKNTMINRFKCFHKYLVIKCFEFLLFIYYQIYMIIKLIMNLNK